ncbi:hypothetical protein MTP06_55250 [Streptomyces sp. PLM4]|nr:hypothetical protein MTP06_55250 [Streptomyces sp. PLM4]
MSQSTGCDIRCSDRDSGRGVTVRRRRRCPGREPDQLGRNVPGVSPVARRKAAPKALEER